MTLQIVFLAAFFVGLVLAVVFMLFGVERTARPVIERLRASDIEGWRQRVDAAQRQVRARMTLPSIGAFAIGFGACGYLLARYSGLSPVAQVISAAIVGAISIVALVVVIAAWAVPSARREEVDDRYLLQGHIARVTRSIGGDRPGEIVYDLDGTTYTAAAVGLDGSVAEVGSEVVIERIENGCAYVEPWSIVEKRL